MYFQIKLNFQKCFEYFAYSLAVFYINYRNNNDLIYDQIFDILLKNTIFSIATFSESKILPILMYFNLSFHFFSHVIDLLILTLTFVNDTLNN